MPITPHLNGLVFRPEAILAMGVALDNACKSLQLTGKSDPFTKLIAAKIIELARGGEHDPGRLCAGVLAVYKPLEK